MSIAPLFPDDRDGAFPASALSFGTITRRRCARLIAEWHRSQPIVRPLNVLRACYGACFAGEIYAVAAWSNPVARALDQWRLMELRRFAIAPDAPANTGSRMLGWMARDIRRRYPRIERLITYQDTQVYTGTIYRAAGWSGKRVPPGGGWCNRGRGGRTCQGVDPKCRWELQIR